MGLSSDARFEFEAPDEIVDMISGLAVASVWLDNSHGVYVVEWTARDGMMIVGFEDECESPDAAAKLAITRLSRYP